MAIERIEVARQYWRESGFSHLQRYLFARERIEGRVLDVACGVGYGSYLLGATCASVLGVDLSAEAIADARAHHLRPNVAFHLGSLSEVPSTTPFDAAVCLETIEHVSDPHVFLKELHGRLKPGGRLVLSAPNVLQHTRASPPVPNPYHHHEPTYAELLAWIAPFFVLEEEWEQTRLLAPQHDRIESLALAGATVGQYKTVRWLMGLERFLRRLTGRTLPPVVPAVNPTDALIAETALVPLLPARREIAHTFLIVARRNDAIPPS
ncbi:MAG TPA: class I SAM-dependent methyltransferase [Candidatus Didemnitutus sp.]|nr:class I SAM-dependent methyltransferase [Candidatus Didemnitutus sp.]